MVRIRKRVLLATRCKLFSLVFLFQPTKDSRDLTDQAADPQPMHATGLFTDKGHVLEMIPDNLTITQIVVFLDQTVVKCFEFGVSNQLEVQQVQDRTIWRLKELYQIETKGMD